MIPTELPWRRLQSDLATQGFAKITAGSLDGFRSICGTLGRISQTIEVRLKPEETQYPYRPDPVPFHTDHPRVPVVAWYCVKQDVDVGENLIIDTRRVVADLSDHDRRALTGIQMRMMHRSETLPLLSLEPYQLYWLPVVVQEAAEAGTETERSAIAALQKALDAYVADGKAVSIRLAPGEALFVNNEVVLHGRNAIPRHSERFLVRAYVVKE